MDITYNKVDQTALPIDTTRVSASEYNQIAGSLMNIITSAGLTPDSQDNAQLLNALGPRIVETYSNGTSWYRVWSDGWCEQGGTSTATSVVFQKAFKDASYNLQATPHINSNSQVYWSDFGHTKTPTGFSLRTSTSTDWYACGYIS